MPSLAEYEAAVLASSPAAWYKADEASGQLQDSSGNGLHLSGGTIAAYQEPGPFAGWSSIKVINTTSGTRANIGTQTDNITVEMWVMVDAVGANNQGLMANQTGGTQGWGLLVHTNRTFSIVVQGIAFTSQSLQTLDAGVWYHVVVTRRAGTWKFYVNGEIDTASAGTQTPNASPTQFAVVSGTNITAHQAQAAYYTTSLSDATIQAHYTAASPDPVSRARWASGTLTAPGATGDVSVTGLAGRPKAVFFFGANFLTEDTAVTTTGTALFRGMAAGKFDDLPTIVENAAAFSPSGDQHINDNYAILNLTTAGTATVLYRANLSSFDADGFTVSFDIAAAGGYKIGYVALMDVTNAAGVVGTTNQSSIAFGFKATASLLHGAWAGPVITGTDRTQDWFGGGAYPGTASGGWKSAGMLVGSFPTSAFQQATLYLTTDQPHIRIAAGVHSSGPFLVISNIVAAPTGTGLLNMTFNGDANDGGMLVAWDDDRSSTGSVTPGTNAGDQTTVSGLPFAPGLLILYSLSNEPQGQTSSDPLGARGAGGMSVITRRFQWSGLIDGVDSRGSYQSFVNGFADTVSGTDVHAGTVRLTGDGFVLTAVEDGVGPTNILWHAFGYPTPAAMVPQLYRRRIA